MKRNIQECPFCLLHWPGSFAPQWQVRACGSIFVWLLAQPCVFFCCQCAWGTRLARTAAWGVRIVCTGAAATASAAAASARPAGLVSSAMRVSEMGGLEGGFPPAGPLQVGNRSHLLCFLSVKLLKEHSCPIIKFVVVARIKWELEVMLQNTEVPALQWRSGHNHLLPKYLVVVHSYSLCC